MLVGSGVQGRKAIAEGGWVGLPAIALTLTGERLMVVTTRRIRG